MAFRRLKSSSDLSMCFAVWHKLWGYISSWTCQGQNIPDNKNKSFLVQVWSDSIMFYSQHVYNNCSFKQHIYLVEQSKSTPVKCKITLKCFLSETIHFVYLLKDCSGIFGNVAREFVLKGTESWHWKKSFKTKKNIAQTDGSCSSDKGNRYIGSTEKQEFQLTHVCSWVSCLTVSYHYPW